MTVSVALLLGCCAAAGVVKSAIVNGITNAIAALIFRLPCEGAPHTGSAQMNAVWSPFDPLE
ncbi:hypothetical protein MTX20_32460 [Bradyrhizobium sp. ISRA435]|nr:hypothetical protein MTX20_32460 [Bradyrhizobium sp. ISRA435]